MTTSTTRAAAKPSRAEMELLARLAPVIGGTIRKLIEPLVARIAALEAAPPEVGKARRCVTACLTPDKQTLVLALDDGSVVPLPHGKVPTAWHDAPAGRA